MAEQQKLIRGVFEGGGVKGSALVGALEVTERLGYQLTHVAGTSAGAIIAAFAAAGFTSAEMRQILFTTNYPAFKDRGLLSRVPLVGPYLNVLLFNGLYEGDYFETWVAEHLAQKGVRTFKDLRLPSEDAPTLRYKLQVIASDLTRGKMLVLPRDSAAYGIEPDELSVARALRMSMSIPYFYEPIKLRGNGTPSYIVDGGILSNYPVWIFDEATDDIPTIGYKLVEPDEGKPRAIEGPLSLLGALFSTMMEAHDKQYIETKNFMRTVPIKTLGVQTTDFDVTPQMREQLYRSGIEAAQNFFATWDARAYHAYVAEGEHSRRNEVWEEVRNP